MGIRIALGATSSDILKTFVRPVIVFTVFGILWGQAGIFLFTRFLSSLLFGITPTDPLTLVIISILMIVVAAIASFIPARKATQLDPAKVLRDL
jgi:putative ABC transport system permease protein